MLSSSMSTCSVIAHTIRRQLDLHSTQPVVLVAVLDQKMYLQGKVDTIASYPVSTAKHGVGSRPGSYQTPLGLHRVCDRIGADAPLGMVFNGRRPTGEIVTPAACDRAKEQERDLITSRILRLQGLEPGRNQGEGCDSYERYIYIHGTSDEARIGKAVSHGCIRMTNRDIIDLFNQIPLGTPVMITAEAIRHDD